MTPLRPFSETLPMLLLKSRETVMAHFRPILNAHGLTEQQWRVLRTLDETGPTTAAGLAKRCVILPPSISRILRKLRDDALITVLRSSSDQREVEVSLTDDGRHKVAAIAPEIQEEYQRLHDRIPAADVERLYRILRDFSQQ